MSAATQMLTPGPEAVARLSEIYDEPAWMRAVRQAAWEQSTAMALPQQSEEAWRRTDLAAFPLDEVRVRVAEAALTDLDDLPPCWHQNLASESFVSGTLVHCGGARSYQTLRREDRENGVVFEGLHRALHTHGDLIRRHWMQGSVARADFNAFTALHAALWHGGTFVYVPAGVRVSRPLQSLVSYDADAGSSLHHTLVIAEEGSRLSLIQDRVSQERAAELNLEVVEIYAQPGAWVRYASLQHWGGQRRSVSMQEANLARDANLLWVNGALGGQVSKDFLHSSLNAAGARARMQGYTFATGAQHIDQSTYQHHRAPDTYSDLLFRNVLRDRARTVFYGMVRAEPEAARMEGYQANNNLMLDDARANAIPGLEIRSNDVQCSHGATLSRIDDEELFYLRSRGLPYAEAARLIVQGYVRPIVEQVPLAHLRERLEMEIEQRFWQGT
jgi:Fe-S cluster assembly protein SufD